LHPPERVLAVPKDPKTKVTANLTETLRDREKTVAQQQALRRDTARACKTDMAG
jgi:hypothetical protein